jgi:hypothetical protein
MGGKTLNDSVVEWAPTRGFMPLPHYSTDIAAAWEVVERLKSEGHDFVITSCQQEGFKNWYVKITCKPDLYYIAQGDHESAAHAICVCAFEACTSLVRSDTFIQQAKGFKNG